MQSYYGASAEQIQRFHLILYETVRSRLHLDFYFIHASFLSLVLFQCVITTRICLGTMQAHAQRVIKRNRIYVFVTFDQPYLGEFATQTQNIDVLLLLLCSAIIARYCYCYYLLFYFRY